MTNYVVQTELVLRSNVVQVLESMGRELRGFDRLVLATQSNLDRLTSSLQKLGATDRVVSRLAASLDKIRAASNQNSLGSEFDKAATSMRAVLTTTEALSRALRDNAKLASDQAAAMARAASTTRNAPSPQNAARHAAHGTGGIMGHDAMLASMGMAGVGHATLSLAERAIHESFNVRKIEAQLSVNREITPEQIRAARTEAERLVKAVPGSTVAGNLEIIRHGVANLGAGHMDEAIQTAEAMAEVGQFLARMDAHRGGTGDQHRSINSLFKWIEDSGQGVDRSDPAHPHVTKESLISAARLAMRIYAGTQGQVGPNELFAIEKQARGAGLSQDAAGWMHFAPVASALGPSRGGTALASTFQQFLVGRMTKQTFEEAQRAGIYNRTARWKGGRVIDASHHLAQRDLAGRDVIAWTNEVIKPYLSRIGALRTAADGAIALGSLAGRTTTWGLLAEAIVADAQIERQYQTTRNTVGDPAGHMRDNDPTTRIAAFKAAENEFMVAMGDFLAGPAITVLNKLSETLHGITDWSKAHPDIAEKMSQFAVGLGLVTGALGAAMLSLMPWMALARLLGAGGTAAAAGAGAAAAGGGATGWLARLFGLAGAGSVGAVAATMGGAGAAAGAMNMPMVDDNGREIGNWGGTQGEANRSRIPPPITPPPTIALPPPPLTEGQLRRHAPWLAAPQDGFREDGRPISNLQAATVNLTGAANALAAIGPPPPVQQTVQVRVQNSMDGRTIGEMVAEFLVRQGQRAPASSGGFDPRMGGLNPTTPF